MRNVDYIHLSLLGVIIILLVIRLVFQVHDRKQKLWTCPVCFGIMYGPAFKRQHDICPNCHNQFGYTDSGTTIAELRQEWLEGKRR